MPGQVDHDPAFAGPVARAAAAAAADGESRPSRAWVMTRATSTAPTTRHCSRSAIDALEDDLTGLAVRGIVWADHLAVQFGAEMADRDVMGWRR